VTRHYAVARRLSAGNAPGRQARYENRMRTRRHCFVFRLFSRVGSNETACSAASICN